MNAGRSAGRSARASALAVFIAFLRLGLTSFGGPVAHLGYFRAEFVERRQWLDDRTYGDVVALCQFLPGPASSQTGVVLGMMRAGLAGGFAAWLGFTLPSALAMIAFGYGLARSGDVAAAAWLHGLKIVAVAVVALALSNMARTLTPDRGRAAIALVAALLALLVPGSAGQIGAILLGGLAGWRLLPAEVAPASSLFGLGIDRRLARASLALFFLLLFGLPLLALLSHNHAIAVVASFYRSGALVFGGGHVVLPLLQQSVVPPGWVSNDAFLAGYGAAQAVPGPLFSFAAYLGTVMTRRPHGWTGGLLCLAAIYAPSFLLLVGILPFWDDLRRRKAVQAALMGVNAAVVGLLLAALYTPVWTSAIFTAIDFAACIVALLLLGPCRVPVWAVVALAALAFR